MNSLRLIHHVPCPSLLKWVPKNPKPKKPSKPRRRRGSGGGGGGSGNGGGGGRYYGTLIAINELTSPTFRIFHACNSLSSACYRR